MAIRGFTSNTELINRVYMMVLTTRIAVIGIYMSVGSSRPRAVIDIKFHAWEYIENKV